MKKDKPIKIGSAPSYGESGIEDGGQVNTDEGHKLFRLKMKQMEHYVVKLSNEEFDYLVTLVTSEMEEREKQLQ